VQISFNAHDLNQISTLLISCGRFFTRHNIHSKEKYLKVSIYILEESSTNETNPIQYSISQCIVLDQFFHTRYQKMGDLIALAIQYRGIGSNDCVLGLGLYCNPNPIPKGCELCIYWGLD
jgi:hypothetical protein